MNGKYVGGTATTVRFEALGNVQVLSTGDLIALTFTSSGLSPVTPAAAAPAPSANAATQPAPSPTPQNVTLPAGTLLLVRMKDGIEPKPDDFRLVVGLGLDF